jgi:tetratricopeptide (TPR) repeat protein
MGFFRRLFGSEAKSVVESVKIETRPEPAGIRQGFSSEIFEIPSRRFMGLCVRSSNARFTLTWNDNFTGRSKYFLLRGLQIVAEGTLARPNDGAVTDNGTFIFNEWGTGEGLKGTFRAFNDAGEALIAKKFAANLFNNGLSLDGRYAAVQTANAPGSDDSSVLTVFDLVQRAQIGRFVPQSGWADQYRFHDDGTIDLGYQKLGFFRYSLAGEFIDRGLWEEAQLTRGDYSMTLITVQRILKDHGGKPDLDLTDRLIRAIDRVTPLIMKENEKTKALAKRLRGECLEACGDRAAALASYLEALRIDPKVGVKRQIDRLTKAGQP